MKHAYSPVLCIVLAVTASGIIFSSCKETVVSSATPGDIVGFVQVYDSLGLAADDNSGIQVSLPGTAISAMSERSGRWQLKNVSPGTYKIFFTKPGYSSFEDVNLITLGNGTYYYNYSSTQVQPVKIRQLTDLYPDIVLRPFEDTYTVRDSSYYDSSGYYHYKKDTTIFKYFSTVFSSNLQTSQNNYEAETAIYYSKTKTIDPKDPKTFVYVSPLVFYSTGTNLYRTVDITILRSSLIGAGFLSGDSIYCIAYAGLNNILNGATWVDPETGKMIYAGFSPHHSEIRVFVLP